MEYNSNLSVSRRRESTFCKKIASCVGESTTSPLQEALQFPSSPSGCAFRIDGTLLFLAARLGCRPRLDQCWCQATATATKAPGEPRRTGGAPGQPRVSGEPPKRGRPPGHRASHEYLESHGKEGGLQATGLHGTWGDLGRSGKACPNPCQSSSPQGLGKQTWGPGAGARTRGSNSIWSAGCGLQSGLERVGLEAPFGVGMWF